MNRGAARGAAVRRPILVLLLALTGAGWSQDTIWTRVLDTGGNDQGNGGIVDRFGNPVVMFGSWPEGGDEDTATFTVVKYTPSGDVVWSRTYDSEAPVDEALDIASDVLGNIVVAGWYYYTEDSCGGQLVKYDRDGNLLWVRRHRQTTYTMLGGLTIDDSMNIYTAGTVCDVPWVWDAILLKFSADGELIWAKTHDFDSEQEWLYRLVWDREGDLVGVGSVGEWPTAEILVVKYDRDGDTVWSRRVRLCEDQCGWGIAVDPENNIVIAGTGDQGVGLPSVCLTAKLSPDGDLLWASVYQRPDTMMRAYGVAIDSAGDAVVGGGAGRACLLLKYAPLGDTLWTRRYQLDYRDYGTALAFAGSNELCVFGTTADQGFTNPDMFVMKLRYGSGVEEPEVVRMSRNPADAAGPTLVRRGELLRLAVKLAGDYRVSLCDAAGRTVCVLHSGRLEPGEHSFSLAAIPAGVYFCRLESGPTRLSHKVVLTTGN